MQVFAMAGNGRAGRGFFSGEQTPITIGYAPTYYPGVITASDAGKRDGCVPGRSSTASTSRHSSCRSRPCAGSSSAPRALCLCSWLHKPAAGVRRRADPARRRASGRQLRRSPACRPGVIGGDAIGRTRRRRPKMATQTSTSRARNITGLMIALQPGVSIVGLHHPRISGNAGAGRLLDVSRGGSGRLTASVSGGPGGGPNASGARAEKNGRFQIDSVFPGAHDLRVSGPGAWTLKSVSVDGRDVTDQPIEIKRRTEPGRDHDRTHRSHDPDHGNGARPGAAGRSQRNRHRVPAGRAALAAAIAPDPGGAHGSRPACTACATSPPGDYNLAVGRRPSSRASGSIRRFSNRSCGRDPSVSIAEGEQKTQDLTVVRAPCASSTR